MTATAAKHVACAVQQATKLAVMPYHSCLTPTPRATVKKVVLVVYIKTTP